MTLQGGCTDSDDGTVEAITVWCPEVIDALRAALARQEQTKPAAWIDGSGHPRHISYVQSATERRLYGPLRPLYEKAPQQEQGEPVAPVATLHDDGCFTWKNDEFRRKYDRHRAGWRMDVYASPPPRKQLTDEQIDAIPFIVDFKAATLRDLAVELRRFARAIEKAITGETP